MPEYFSSPSVYLNTYTYFISTASKDSLGINLKYVNTLEENYIPKGSESKFQLRDLRDHHPDDDMMRIYV